MRITVLGSGYVGLTQAAVLAHVGHQVICADIDKARIESIETLLLGRLRTHDDAPEETGSADSVCSGAAIGTPAPGARAAI